MLLLGKTSAGKSSLVNTLLGRQAFEVGRGLSSGTEKCQYADTMAGDKLLQVGPLCEVFSRSKLFL